jgi:N-acetylmuramoyl-L-alanine amidase-like protein/zinc carboxypeptidase
LSAGPGLRFAVAGAVAAATVAAGYSPAAAGPAHAGGRRVTFGRSVDGTPLRAVRLGPADARRTALVVGSIHGDETAGQKVVRILRRRYRGLRGVALWTVRTVNPDGVAADSRRNADAVDLNRNFPYRSRGGVPASSGYYPGPRAASEPETRAVMRLIRRLRPRVTIFYHQPWDRVLLPCRGHARIQRRYARLAEWQAERCLGAHLRGTAIDWQNHRVGGTAFVVELGNHALGDREARRQARAAAAVARGGGGRRAAPAIAPAAARPTVGRPRIDHDPIPYGRVRKREMAAYSARHYGQRTWRLRNPHVIVLHFTAGSTYSSAWNTFAANAPDLGELPGTCSQFVIGKTGGIHELVPPTIRCRHTIGLNYTAIGIEMVQEAGPSSHWADRQILDRRPQIRAAVHLVAWLKLRYGIAMRNVIGHAMANRSPFFKDLEGWRSDHTDWLHRDVVVFRQRLRRFIASHRGAKKPVRTPRTLY